MSSKPITAATLVKETNMIGCLILGTLGALVVAKIVRHHLGWAACHGGGGYGGGWGRW